MQNLIFMYNMPPELIGLDLCIILASCDNCAFNPTVFFFSFITFDFYFITSICWLSQLLTKNSISLTSNKQRGQDYSEHGYWMAGRLSLQTRYHIASLFQQTLFQQRHLLEAAPSYCSEGKEGKTPRRRSRKLINSIYHSRRDLSCVLPHHDFPQFYIFLHFVSDLEGEDGVGTLHVYLLKWSKRCFLSLTFPILWPRRVSPEPNL